MVLGEQDSRNRIGYTKWSRLMKEYIETKGAESHFEGIAEDCLKMIHGINAECIQAIKDRPCLLYTSPSPRDRG